MFKLDLTGPMEADEGAIYDLIVIGAGPAGFTCAIYTSREGWKTLILEKAASGGLIAKTHRIENYPGFPDGIDGSELMERFQAQALRFGAQLAEFEEVTSIERLQQGTGESDPIFHLKTNSGKTYQGRAVLLATGNLLLATGNLPKKLGIPGEAEYFSKGVSYCATCDGPLYKDQDTIVVGAGNSGLLESEILLKYAKSVKFIEFLSYSTAAKVMQERVFNHPKASILLNHMLTEIKGGKTVTSVMVKNRDSGELTEIPTKAVFIYVGYEPPTDFIKGLVKLDKAGYIITDEHMATSLPGIFAAGDVRSNNLAQCAVAVGDGAKAARGIREYLHKQKG